MIIRNEKRGLMMEKKNGRCSKEVYETAINFARMWGVLETLKPLPYLDFPQVLDMVMKWAQEYVNCGGGDLAEFFQKKAVQVALTLTRKRED